MAAATAVAVDPKQYAQEAVKKITAIATLPEVTSKIISTVEDPKASASTLHKIVSHDPALVTRILKVVNSAFYGLPGQKRRQDACARQHRSHSSVQRNWNFSWRRHGPRKNPD